MMDREGSRPQMNYDYYPSYRYNSAENSPYETGGQHCENSDTDTYKFYSSYPRNQTRDSYKNECETQYYGEDQSGGFQHDLLEGHRNSSNNNTRNGNDQHHDADRHCNNTSTSSGYTKANDDSGAVTTSVSKRWCSVLMLIFIVLVLVFIVVASIILYLNCKYIFFIF